MRATCNNRREQRKAVNNAKPPAQFALKAARVGECNRLNRQDAGST
jgi:hypothetical protein